MAGIIHYNNCPACDGANPDFLFKATDHTVTGESFPVYGCRKCSLRFTQDVPDEESIAVYYQSPDYVSHSDSSKGMINKLYQRVRKRTIRSKRKMIERLTGLERGSILDVGSGTGSFLTEMKNEGWIVNGLEPDAGARLVAKNRYGLDLADVKALYSLPPNSFDVITLWHVLEHVHNLHGYIDQLRSLMKESGLLIVAVPNYKSRDAATYKEYWAGWDVPRHLYHFSPVSMQQLMNAHNLKVTDHKPMWYDSFYVSLLSTRYKYKRTGYLSGFLVGLLSNLTAMSNVKKCSSVIYVIRKNKTPLTD